MSATAMRGYYPLGDLDVELKRQQAAKVDYLAPTDAIHFISDEQRSEIYLRGTDVEKLVVNDHAHGQMASRLGIPKRYYDFIRSEIPTLLDQTVNRLLRHHPDADVGKNWMVRALDGYARAFLSDLYLDVDNLDVSEAALRVLSRGGLNANIVSCGLSDMYLYIKATTPRLRAEVRVGEEVCAGVAIKNSEVGASSLVVAPLVYVSECSNGMILEEAGRGMMRQIHLGPRIKAVGENRVVSQDDARRTSDRAAVLREVENVVRDAVDEIRFQDLVRQMSDATHTEPLRDAPAGIRVLQKREGLSDEETGSVLSHLAESDDRTLWGVLNAVTRTAQDADNYDRATQLEAKGGKILSYEQRDWQSMVTATP